MPSLGGYTSVVELHRSGLGSVYSAVRDGEAGPPAYCLRTATPDAAILGDEAAAKVVAGFLERAAAHKAVADDPACSRRWARVHTAGRADTADGPGAFLVTDLATRGSAARLASGRVRLEGPALAYVVGEVVGALRDLRAARGRAHGRLRATDVLLIAPPDAELTQARVALTDPAPPAELGPGAPLADLRAVGELVHLLVLHAPFRGGWPVQYSPAWSALGQGGSRWIELVNTLLDPNDGAARPTLEELSDRLAVLGVVRRSRGPLVIAAAAATLLLAGGITTAVLVLRSRPTDPAMLETRWGPDTQARWDRLCDAYIGWFRQFGRGLDKPPTGPLAQRYKTRREAYAATDPQLKEILALPGVAPGNDPWSIAGVSEGSELKSLKSNPTKAARTDGAVKRTEDALDAIARLKTGLTEGWALPARLRTTAGDYRERGWTAAAAEIDAVAAKANPEKASDEGADPAEAVDKVLAVVPAVDAVAAHWDRARDAARALEPLGDPVLSRLGPSLAAMIAAGPGGAGTLTALEASARSVADLAADLAAFVKAEWPKVDPDSFYASPRFVALKAEPPSVEVYTAWKIEARAHPSLDPKDDPRTALDAPAGLAAIDGAAATLAAAPLDVRLDDALRARVERARSDAGALAALPWNRRNRADVEARAQALRSAIAELRTTVDGLLATRRAELATSAREVREALARPDAATASPAVNRAWDTWRAELLRGFKDEAYAQTRVSAKALRDAAVALAGAGFPAPLERAGDGVPAADWAGALADATAAERERRLAQALAELGPAPAPEAVAGIGRTAGPAFAGFVDAVRRMRTELAAAVDALDGGAEGGEAGLDAALARWSADPAGKAPEVAAAVGGLKDRVQATKALAAVRDPAALAQRILQPDPAKPELALVAWKRLGDADVGWPSTPEHLAQAATLRASLVAVIGRLAEARRAPLERQVDRDLADRWARYAAAQRDPRRLEAALAAIGEFRADTAALEPRLRYNLLVSRLRAEASAQWSDAQVQTRLRQFESDVRALAGLRPPQKFSTGVADLAQGAEPVKETVRPETLGPAKTGRGWTGSSDGAKGTVAFTLGGVTLPFVRVEVNEPGQAEAVFICARELTIEDAAAILGSQGVNALSSGEFLSDDNRAGPRGWVVAGGRLTPGPWIKANASIVSASAPVYAPGLVAPGQAVRLGDSPPAAGEPRSTTPLQGMPALALATIARTAGCRFPTVAEWKAAHNRFDGGRQPAGALLRGAAFKRQQDHVVAMRASPALTLKTAYPFPDDGVFTAGRPPTGPAAAVRPGVDGVIWFAAANASLTDSCEHLVGNVAELVLQDGAKFESTPAASIGSALAGVAVIGGSSLSAPEMPLDAPIPFNVNDDEGFADIGARLAFNASGTAPPRESFASRLGKLLTDEAYLLQGP